MGKKFLTAEDLNLLRGIFLMGEMIFLRDPCLPHYLAHDINKFFFSIWVFFCEHSRITGLQRKWGGYFFNPSLPLPPASQTLRHWPGDCCWELTSAHSWQPDSNREPLISERKSLTTKLRALDVITKDAIGFKIVTP